MFCFQGGKEDSMWEGKFGKRMRCSRWEIGFVIFLSGYEELVGVCGVWRVWG